jgi:L-arabinose isomerase
MENPLVKFIHWVLVEKRSVRLVFNVKAGAALNASVVDMGNRFVYW